MFGSLWPEGERLAAKAGQLDPRSFVSVRDVEEFHQNCESAWCLALV